MLHEAWHVLVLVVVLSGAAAAAALGLHAVMPELRVLDRSGPRRAAWGMVAFAASLVAWEWTGVH